ncbi:hypothetical protein [Microvirga rosea]|uniref:hypothetical protein n=1 Tax=Microvirga rosea TaxID=2715425 RepID=UPI001D0AC96F|nr:hypothetical protein [Microvirga rosea]MCB8823410.1 hypothetical protein [Microvirga rosea]
MPDVRVSFLLAWALLGMGGCAAVPDEGPVAGRTVEAILNGVQCEFAIYLQKHPDSPVAKNLLSGKWVAGGELETKIDTAAGGKASVGASAIPMGSGAFGLGAGFDRSERRGRASKIRFRIPATKAAKALCDSSTPVEGIGVEEWLAQYASLTPAGLPLEPKDFTYGLTFAVSTGANGSVTVLQAVRVSAEAFAKRDDVQLLALAINPRPDPFTYVKIVSGAGAGAHTLSEADKARSPLMAPIVVPIPGPSGIDVLLDQKRRELLPQ